MIKLNYLPINKSKTKMDRFIIGLDGANYIFEIYWNSVGEFFVFNLYDIDEEPIILSRKITYESDMLSNIADKRVPGVEIIPLNPAEESGSITFENFQDSVKCYIFQAGDQ